MLIPLGHTTPDQDARLLSALNKLACPQCGHPCLRIVRDAEVCDECGYTRRKVPVPAVSVPVSAYQPQPGT